LKDLFVAFKANADGGLGMIEKEMIEVKEHTETVLKGKDFDPETRENIRS
jgi:hypothetical protein